LEKGAQPGIFICIIMILHYWAWDDISLIHPCQTCRIKDLTSPARLSPLRDTYLNNQKIEVTYGLIGCN
jgi:hypothetical protein